MTSIKPNAIMRAGGCLLINPDIISLRKRKICTTNAYLFYHTQNKKSIKPTTFLIKRTAVFLQPINYYSVKCDLGSCQRNFAARILKTTTINAPTAIASIIFTLYLSKTTQTIVPRSDAQA